MPNRKGHGTGLAANSRRTIGKTVSTDASCKASVSAPALTEVGCRPMVEGLEARQMLSSTWFVSTGGSNGNPGTASAPFQTIQQAANVAKPGDHVEIMAGTYHEMVVPKRSGTAGAPIVFEAYNGGKVTVDAADSLSGWSSAGGNIYSASMPWDLGEGSNEVFVNGQAINEARFPNTAIGDFSHPGTLTIDSVAVHGNSATIYSSALNQPANSWKGAIIHMDPGQAWVDQTGVVTSSSPGSVTVSFGNMGGYSQPKAGNQFYLFGAFKALDSAGEWYRDPTDGRLYVWTPNGASPATQDVEVKHRTYAFNLNAVHDVTLQGLNVFGAGILSGYNSYDIVLNGVHATYVAQKAIISSPWYVTPDQGVVLRGAHSTIENCTVSFASDDGIVVNGAGSVVRNNIVHDVSYNGCDTGGIHILGAGDIVDHNTIYNSGRHGILVRVPRVSITYNTIHDVGLQTTEAGGIYTSSTNGEGAVIAYNEVYNMHGPGYGETALFTDNKSSGWVLHNNATWNVDYALKMNFSSNNNIIYNNTLGATKLSINSNQIGNWNGSKIYSNVFAKAIVVAPGAAIYANIYASSSAGGVGAGDFASGAVGVH